jgi:hypothetical protein
MYSQSSMGLKRAIGDLAAGAAAVLPALLTLPLWMLNPSITSFGDVVHDGPPPVEALHKLSAEWRGL